MASTKAYSRVNEGVLRLILRYGALLWNSISEFKIIYIDDRILNLSEFKSNMVKDGNITIYFGLKFPKPESGNWSIRVILHQETNQNDEIQILEEKQLYFRLDPEQERIRNFLQRSESD